MEYYEYVKYNIVDFKYLLDVITETRLTLPILTAKHMKRDMNNFQTLDNKQHRTVGSQRDQK